MNDVAAQSIRHELELLGRDVRKANDHVVWSRNKLKEISDRYSSLRDVCIQLNISIIDNLDILHILDNV